MFFDQIEAAETLGPGPSARPIAPVDRLEVAAWDLAVDTCHHCRVQADGTIRLPVIGKVFVAGRTTDDIAAEIHLGLAADLQMDADVTIRRIK